MNSLTAEPDLTRQRDAKPMEANPLHASIGDLPQARPPWRVVIGALLLGLVAGLLGAEGSVVVELMKQEVWVASAGIEVRDGNVMSESVAVVLESPGLWHPLAELEGIADEEFQKRYRVEVAGATQIVQVNFEDNDQARALRIVDEILTTYIAGAKAPEEVVQTEKLEAHLEALTDLEASLTTSLEQADDLPRLQQIDLQNELVRTRQQITTVIFRLDARATDLLERRDVDPRIVTEPFILDEPVTPDPLKASVFGFAAGGLVGLVALYLVFHREAQSLGTASGPMARSTGGQRRFDGSAVTGIETPTGRFMKRSMDIILASTVLLVLVPVLALVTLLVKLTSRGPALFKQDRIGRDDRPFKLYKFRTMTTNNDDSEHRDFVLSQLEQGDKSSTSDGRFKLDDSRVTMVGRPLRRFSIDELPQLWNVLKGDMSLVGPRPALPWEASMFEARFRERTKAAPGCTGLWQVSGRSQVSVRRMLELDLEYVQTRSLFKDLLILLRTPLVVVRGDGAR